LLLFSLSSVQADETRDVLLFLEGVAYGLEIRIGNVNECAADLNLTLTEFKKGLQKIGEGLEWLDIWEIEDGLKEWAKGVNAFASALDACGAEKIAADIIAIMEEFAEGIGGIFKWVLSELLAIIENDVYDLFSDAIEQFEKGKYYESGVSTGKILGILLNQGRHMTYRN